MYQFDDYTDYMSEMAAAYEENPVCYLEKQLLNINCSMSVVQVIKLLIDVKKEWGRYIKYGVQCGILLVNDPIDRPCGEYIARNNFTADLAEVIQTRKKSVLYTINDSGCVIEKRYLDECLDYDKFSRMAQASGSIALFLGLTGVDTLIGGVPFETQNRFDSYQDIINVARLSGIDDYRGLLARFFDAEVQYDPYEQYFVRTKDVQKSLHPLLEKHPKLLNIKPEERFQRYLEKFLRSNCIDNVLTEVRNRYGERYDVWVATSDEKLYVFEIKWLGKSLTAEGNVFEKYNTSERAIAGAYQLKDYIDSTERYAEQFGPDGIYCGVLVVFDARMEMSVIDFPVELDNYPQIDLTQHFKVDKDKIRASQKYEYMKRA